MSNLNPTPGWDGVPQLETTTVAIAGPGGPMNLQAQALLNRTEYLKGRGGIEYVEDHGDNTVPGTTDTSAAWNAAIAAVAGRGGKVRSRSGALFRASNIALKPGVQIELDGAELRPDANQDCFTMSGTATTYGRTIIGGGRIAAAAASNGYGVRIDGNFPYITLDGLFIEAMARGAYLRGAYGSLITGCRAVGCGIGYEFAGETHASQMSNNLSDYCTIAGAAVNYNGGSNNWLHNPSFAGTNAFQNSPVGLWLERCYEVEIGSLYHEGNTACDLRVGVADSGAYNRKVQSLTMNGPFNSASACPTNIIVEHSTGIRLQGLSFQAGSASSTHVSIDGFSADWLIHYHALANTSAPFSISGSAASKGVISNNGRGLFPSGLQDAIEFGTYGSKQGRISHDFPSWNSFRSTTMARALANDLGLMARDQVRFFDSPASGNPTLYWLMDMIAGSGTQGDLQNLIAGKGIILKTPDGTKNYRISISNAGAVTATLV